MRLQNSKLVLRQIDKKLAVLYPLNEIVPSEGWVKQLRTVFNMSLRQLGQKMSITPQSVKAIERREAKATITLKTLKDAAGALDMTFVYGFIPKDGSLEKMIGRKAREMAEKIVRRTSATMKLEDQENSKERIQQAIDELTKELEKEMPKSLWD